MSDLSQLFTEAAATSRGERAAHAFATLCLLPVDREVEGLTHDLRALQAQFDRYGYTENRNA